MKRSGFLNKTCWQSFSANSLQEENNIEDENEAADEEMQPQEEKAEMRKTSTRSMLSATSTVPERSLQRFKIPDQCSISRTVHRDSTLPLFQGRLPWGKFYEGK